VNDRVTERRVVTALFVDVVGSSALTVALGPERLKRALDRAFAELQGLIEAEGGTLEKFVGDAIHALFGAPAAHPDDPQRALRAADACARWGEARADASVPFAVRVGVETGEAIVDLGAVTGARQQMSVGACVNLAARLQQLAEPGQVLVGPMCHAATGDIADFAPLGERELKGLGRFPVWRLEMLVAPRPPARLPFVGRRAELDLLRAAHRRAAAGRSVLALVLGPPGQGKTRLVDEFVGGLEPEARVLRARCRPAGELGAQTPFQALLAAGQTAPSWDELAARVSALFGDPSERRRILAALAHSGGIRPSDDLAALSAAERRDEVTNGWRRYLAALGRERPLVMSVDDLHWAEAEFVSLLDRLTLGAFAPLLVIATARPELTEQVGLRPGGDRFFVELDGLDPGEASLLARHAGARGEADVGRAEGNPLFIIELARARAPGPEGAVPLTLQGVIGARLDELPPRDRDLLQRVAVVGERFTVADAAVLSGRETADVGATLERLAERLFLHRTPDGYGFHHALVRDVAYGRLPAAERLQLHARYAEVGRQPADAEARAHHLWQALGGPDADWVWESDAAVAELRARAYEAHLTAGRRYADRLAIQLALDAYRRALRFAATPVEEAVTEQALGAACAADARGDEAWRHFVRACELFKGAGAPRAEPYAELAELASWTPGMFHELPDAATVEAVLAEGEALARRDGPPAVLARLLVVRTHFGHRGRQTLDTAPLEEGLRLLENAAEPRPFARFLVHAAGYQVRWGHYQAAEHTFRHLDQLAATGHRADQADEYRSALAIHTGKLAVAEDIVARFERENAARGPHLRSHSNRERAHLLLARGEWARLAAVAAATERLVADSPGTAFCYAVTTTRAHGAVAHAVLGRRGEAEHWLARAEQPLTSLPFSTEEVLLLAYGVLGRRREAEQLIHTVRRRGPGLPPFFRRTESTVLTMLDGWEPLAEALAALDTVASRGNPAYAALAAAVREEAAARQGGPPAAHGALRALGYTGWSALLAWRPRAA
jgi:class 3 adenylate cyclase